ncbi:branched-chain amino acid ABC transporter permease [Aliihoeflea sp. 2WW]|uniref:branched-chain amino acid ABC transporter permease n=1 Tax=Aliihoeflea sp. 2WW TaxID=1381123 RepID=UPI0004668743|nr:branched-chain amino acid ABC transporter permease [Aliihoeflea sp. 2WW]
MAEFLQILFSGITVGAVYALVALGFTLVYNASHVVSLAQGEFVMLGGMVTAALVAAGFGVPLAALFAVAFAVMVGLAVYRFSIAPAAGASPITLIIITLGVAIFIQGVTMVVLGKQIHSLPPFLGSEPLLVGGATVLPQGLLVVGGCFLLVVALFYFLERTLVGKALMATAANRLAAQLVGIDTRVMLALAFAASAIMGAIAGILVTPLTLTRFDIGIVMTVKGFAAAMLGGIGSPFGAVVGGLLLGVLEGLGAGYVNSAYKDAIAFLAILLTFAWRPQGLFGRKMVERV